MGPLVRLLGAALLKAHGQRPESEVSLACVRGMLSVQVGVTAMADTTTLALALPARPKNSRPDCGAPPTRFGCHRTDW